jgi:triacylglycerol lipase
MSPRRRAVVAASALLAVVVLVLALVRATRAGDAADAVPVRQDRPGPVVLVPGYGGGTVALGVLQRALEAAGRRAVLVPAVGGGTVDLRVQAREVERVVTGLVADGAPSVDVVGYSAGGVVARIWLAEGGGDRLARRVVTLGSPHHGTSVAELGGLVAPGSCPAACRQLIPGSELLDRLPETVPGPRYTSLWTAHDDVVTPPESARLSGAVNVPLQAVCADDTTEHGRLPTDPLAVGIVLRAVAVTPLAVPPAPAECGALRASGSALL